ncbi:ankyrin repeat and SOCS box protein 12-like [Polypterus senegalus]|uniref:ankyrin repeat and SOCS box protein 12-like n=1 Tax=Polypterus senegalus TaxID=55291 RepID=UPI00196452C9|nr:ankyrin repeat and SOCS box protein 12-like [Polypterus senegalus]
MLHLAEEEDKTSDAVEKQELHEAVFNNNHRLLLELLSQEQYRKFINSRSGWGIPGTPLRVAASHGYLSCVELLLAHGAEVDSLDVKAQTPLFTAVSGKHLACVQALLSAGADPNGSIYNNCSPVLTASREGDVDILSELLEHGAEVNTRSKSRLWPSHSPVCSGPLYLSAVYGHLDCFKLLLINGANPDFNCTEEKLLVKIRQPKTILEMCIRHGCEAEYVQLLIDFGANVYLPTLNVEKTTKQKEALELLLRERVCPKRLMSWCRLTIRNALRLAGRLAYVDCLHIPSSLKHYLKHKSRPMENTFP